MRFLVHLCLVWAVGLWPAQVTGADAATNKVLSLSPVPDLKGTLVGDAFRVVQSESWPTGLLPVFSEVEDGRFSLSRLPAHGLGIPNEPLFFLLPPEDEPRAGDIAGHWICSATNLHRAWHEPQWELAIDGEKIAGRFRTDGEYRVALITGGTFRSNRFELKVDWANDRYVLTGEWSGAKLGGQWQQVGEDERGGWRAERLAAPARLPAVKTVPLFEWRRGEERRYSVNPAWGEPGWLRNAQPLGRVWIKP